VTFGSGTTGERTPDHLIAAIELRSPPDADPTAAEAPTRSADSGGVCALGCAMRNWVRKRRCGW
jgi:hypothetical protein